MTDMNERIRPMLRCPACCEPVMDARTVGVDVSKGLRCDNCGCSFPIIDGVLRMMTSRAHKDPAAESFGFEWLARDRGLFETDTLYGLTKEQEIAAFLDAYGIEHSDLRGKTVLDAGCGDGALLELIAGYEPEIIGIDISDSVSIAARRCRQLPNVTILQTDILRPCFATASFDFVWCEGALPCTPNPRKALEAIGRLVKLGGQLYVWVYPSDKVSVYQRVRDLLVAPYRLPRPVLIMLCYSLATAMLPLFRISGRKRSLGTIAFDLFDNLSPRYQWRYTEEEIRRWFGEAGFADLRVTGRVGISGKRIS